MDPELKRALECPVCLERLTAPIQSCSVGHSVCLNCKENVIHCPLCRGPLNGRNVALEAILDLIPISCRHKGCRMTLKAKDCASHQSKCGYRQVSCPKCEEDITYNTFKEHVYKGHSDCILDVYGDEPLKIEVANWTDTHAIVWFLREKSTDILLPYFLVSLFNADEETISICVTTREQTEHCTYTIELRSSSSEWQKLTYSNKTVQVSQDELLPLNCFTVSCTVVNLSFGDVMMVSLTITWDGAVRKKVDTMTCQYKKYGCFQHLALDSITGHERTCGFQFIRCIVDNCGEFIGWGHYWNHVQGHHKEFVCITPSTFNLCISPYETTLRFVTVDKLHRYHVMVECNAFCITVGLFLWAPDDFDATDCCTVKVRDNEYKLSGIKFPLQDMCTYSFWKNDPNCLSLNWHDFPVFLSISFHGSVM